MINDTIGERLDGLRRRYALNLPLKVSQAAESVRAVLAAPRNRALLEAAHRGVHSLTGSSGTYGFCDISRIFREAESMLQESLESGVPLPSERQFHLRELIAGLESLAAAAASVRAEITEVRP